MRLVAAARVVICSVLGSGCAYPRGGPAAEEVLGLEPGHTACGSATCPPGQYCLNQQGGFCLDGCVSDENCLDGYTCDVDPTFSDGICVAEPEAPPAEDPLQGCLDAVDAFQDCGLTADIAADFRGTCAELSEDEQHAVARCGTMSCDDAVSCLGYECFSTSQCDRGEECVGLNCL